MDGPYDFKTVHKNKNVAGQKREREKLEGKQANTPQGRMERWGWEEKRKKRGERDRRGEGAGQMKPMKAL